VHVQIAADILSGDEPRCATVARGVDFIHAFPQLGSDPPQSELPVDGFLVLGESAVAIQEQA